MINIYNKILTTFITASVFFFILIPTCLAETISLNEGIDINVENSIQTRNKQLNQKVESLLQKHLNAIGGLESNKRLNTRQIQGTVTILNIGVPWEYSSTQKAPDKKFSQISIPTVGVIKEGTYGTVSWKKELGRPITHLSGQKLNSKLREARFYSAIEWLQNKNLLSYVGETELDGDKHHILNVSDVNNGSEFFVYLDSSNYLLKRIRIPLNDGVDDVLTFDLDDYEKIDGVLLPFEITIAFDGKDYMSIDIDEITHGMKVSDNLFKEPSDN